MAKTMKSLLRISMVLRNLGTLNNCTVTKRFIQTSTNYTKDTIVSPRLFLVNENPLRSLIKSSTDINEILRIIQENSTRLSASDAIFALDTLFFADKIKPEKVTKLYERKEFITLCEILKKKIQHISIPEAITMLKVLVHFQVPTSSIIVHTVLQIIRCAVNTLSLQQIEFIEFLLSKCEQSHLVGALAIALPIVYENNILLKLDRENIKTISSSLKYISRKFPSNPNLDIITTAIINCKQPIDPLSAVSIMWSFCDIKYVPDRFPEVISIVQNVLAQNIATVNPHSIKHVLGLIASKVKNGETHFYHEGFADACASIVISKDWGFTNAVYVLKKLLLMSHVQISLLDYIAAKCFEDPTILESCPTINILTIVAGFSTADYKPVFWDVIQESLMINDRVIENGNLRFFAMSKLAVYLTSLDCYYPELLGKVFSDNDWSSPEQRVKHGRILLLYQAVNTLFPQYTGPWPKEGVLNFIGPASPQTTSDFPLMETLECALGGRRYVLTNIRSKLGHRIDHILVMRKGGFPIAINNNLSTDSNEIPMVIMNDLETPPGSQVILILCVPEYAYSVNSQRMKGIWSMQIKSLEALSGFTVIPIHFRMWKDLPGSEKMPYLMQAIRLKCDEISISANS